MKALIKNGVPVIPNGWELMKDGDIIQKGNRFLSLLYKQWVLTQSHGDILKDEWGTMFYIKKIS